MKRILFVFLLLVFTAQGVTVATGGSGMAAQMAGLAVNEAAPDDAGVSDGFNSVAADMEEMSDYVAHDPFRHAAGRHVTPGRATTPPLVSIDLPRAPPPPRG